MSARLRLVPELSDHQVHAGALTAEHTGRAVTLAAADGSVVRGTLFSAYPTLTEGRTVLTVETLGTLINIGVPDTAPVHIHPSGESP